MLTTSATAASIDTGSDLTLRWDNTIQLSTIYLPGTAYPNVAGYCGADRAAHACGEQSGFSSGRGDWLSDLDLDYRNVGLHASSAAWYDAVDQHDGELHGRAIELEEAFIHGSTALGHDQELSVRLGRHTIIWGESLYFPENGIAAGQAPVDNYLSRSMADYQAQTHFLPVGQASFSWRASSDLAIEGYTQFEWRRSRIDPEGAYASASDVLGIQSTRRITLRLPEYGVIGLDRIGNQAPGSTGQFGLAAKFHWDELDYGLYGLRSDAKSPVIYYAPDIARYRLTYPTGIETYGASLAGTAGDAGFGAEISVRRNMVLVNQGILIEPPDLAIADNDRHARYPLGDTLHAQFSWSYELAPLAELPGGAIWTGEIAANRLLATTANGDQLAGGRTRTAAAFRTVFEPRFFRVSPGLDLTMPISLGYNFLGLSLIDPSMNRGTGDIGIGVTAALDQTWRGSLTLTHYFGHTKNGAVLASPNDSEALSDWDYAAITLRRTF